MSAGTDQTGYEWDAWVEPQPPRRPPVRLVTPMRVLLFVLVAAAAAVSAYGLLLGESGLQLPITVSGLAILGLTLGMLALSLANAAAALAGSGRALIALPTAFVGGLCAMAGAAALGMAIVLGILATAG
ncbi:MAG TPA: hypothetical protein VNW68_03530 [Candidatus Limnocylindria bacterium]|jgi:hypothetical protein|nr:hypothetical protein [Candidatus Limnocylindria bacterium]